MRAGSDDDLPLELIGRIERLRAKLDRDELDNDEEIDALWAIVDEFEEFATSRHRTRVSTG